MSSIFFSFAAAAGVITLSNGEKISGTITAKTPDYIVVDTGEGTRTFYNDEIFSIRGQKAVPSYDVAPTDMTVAEALRIASQGQFLHAEEAFRQILQKDPSSLSSRKAIEIIDDLRNDVIEREYALALFEGAYHFYNQDFRRALDVYTKALEQYPAGVELYYNIANTHLLLGNIEEGISYFERLLEYRPDDGEVLFKLAVAYQSRGEHERAIYYLKKITAAVTDRADVWLLLASSYEATGQRQLSQDALRTAKAIYNRQGNLKKVEAIDQLLINPAQ